MPCFLEASKYPKGAAVVLFAGGAAYDVVMAWMLFARLFSAGKILFHTHFVRAIKMGREQLGRGTRAWLGLFSRTVRNRLPRKNTTSKSFM